MAVHGANIKIFKDGINAWKEELNLKGIFALREATKDVFTTILHASPCVSGSYILSNKIGVNNPTTTLTLMPDGTVRPKATVVVNAMAYLTGKLKFIKNRNDIVYITNNIPYALDVEYGWPPSGENADGHFGYFPYTKAYEATKMKMGLQ